MDMAASTEAINGQGHAPQREFVLVEPRDLTQYWPLVKAGVEKVAERGSDGWLPEDVYMALKQGVSLLYVGFVDRYYVGFVVVTPAAGWSGPQLHLWLLYNRGERDVLETFLPDLIEIAKARGAQRITMSSPRKGWERRAPQLGFEQGLTNYSLEV
jgi:hypothetical protein